MDEKQDFSDLISISEAARIRNVSHAAIQDLIKRGKISVEEIGGRKLLSRQEIENYKPDTGGRPPKIVFGRSELGKKYLDKFDKKKSENKDEKDTSRD